MELVYLFEEAPVVQSLHPRIPTRDPKERKQWVDTCKKLLDEVRKEQKEEGEDEDFLQLILSERVKRGDKGY